MPDQPSVKRAIAFFDGQNLFHTAKDAYGHQFPNYDPKKLATAIASSESWDLKEVRFYTGIPDKVKDGFWHHFWTAKLANMGRQGVKNFYRSLRYRSEEFKCDDGSTKTFITKQEKGIDVRIALDIVRMAINNDYDVALVFSQDQDLSEVADEVKTISKQNNRWIEIVSAFPVGQGTTNKRGIKGTRWIKIDQTLYDSCIDLVDYRPKSSSTTISNRQQ
jgi:uncharacterized LabA/DUF88 family protein